MKSLLVIYAYHHYNTENTTKVFAKVLNAQIKTPAQINPNWLHEYRLIGFGSGIYGAKHYYLLLNLVDLLPHVTNKHTFIFSTSTMTGEENCQRSLGA